MVLLVAIGMIITALLVGRLLKRIRKKIERIDEIVKTQIDGKRKDS